MFAGAACLGVHMAMTHSITISMVASYMPTGEIKGLGKLSGTAVSFTDLLLGECTYEESCWFASTSSVGPVCPVFSVVGHPRQVSSAPSRPL